MKFGREDAVQLRLPALALLAVLGAGAAAGMGSLAYLDAARRDKAQAERSMGDLRKKLDLVRHEQQDIERFQGRYQQLVDSGMIGDGDRLAWIESAERIRKARGIFTLKYTVGAQRPYAPGAPVAVTGFELRSSPMIFELGLLHEGQLLAFLADLRGEGKGLPVLERCRLLRLVPRAESKFGPNLRADCVVNWVSLKEKQ